MIFVTMIQLSSNIFIIKTEKGSYIIENAIEITLFKKYLSLISTILTI